MVVLQGQSEHPLNVWHRAGNAGQRAVVTSDRRHKTPRLLHKMQWRVHNETRAENAGGGYWEGKLTLDCSFAALALLAAC